MRILNPAASSKAIRGTAATRAPIAGSGRGFCLRMFVGMVTGQCCVVVNLRQHRICGRIEDNAGTLSGRGGSKHEDGIQAAEGE
jgi:hypothetical protein